MWLVGGICMLSVVVLAYLFHVNSILKGVPSEVLALRGPAWTTQQLRITYEKLKTHPIDYSEKLPARLNRRYVVTGGNGLVGGYVVLQLLARGTPSRNIRIIDIRKPERRDLAQKPASDVEFIQTDIRSVDAVNAAFGKPWDQSVARLPLTVFHTAAVILASDRSKHTYDFPYAINVKGTAHIVTAAKAAGADVFSATTSGSISIRPIDPWVSFWAKEPRHFWQILDEHDFDQPLRTHEKFFGNYPASKASAERIVCAANSNEFRTGCIRPVNGVYGNPTDNTVGGPLSRSVFPTWVPHIVQSFVHGANVAVAHLQQEAVLLSKGRVQEILQAGRPFVVTDPNPPIAYSDLYAAIATLSVHPFRTIIVPPVVILLASYIIEWYNLLPYRAPVLRRILPSIKGDARSLQPGLLSICTHLIASDKEARKSTTQGGLGYTGVITTQEGMVLEIVEWNREHAADSGSHGQRAAPQRRSYTTSVTYADQLRQAVDIPGSAMPLARR